MARLNTSIDDEAPLPPPSRPTSSSKKASNASKNPSKPLAKPTKKPVKIVDLSSSPPSPAAAAISCRRNDHPPPPQFSEAPKPRGRRRLIRKQFVMVDSDDEAAQGLGRPSGDRLGKENDDNEEEEDSGIFVTSRRPEAIRSPSSSPVVQKAPIAIAPKRSISRNLPPRGPAPSRSHSRYHPPSYSEAEEVPSSENESSPPPSPEGSGDEINSHSSQDEDEGEEDTDDEYDDSFVVEDSIVEYETDEGEGGEVDILSLVDRLDEINIADDDRGGKGRGKGKTVGERAIERDLERLKVAKRSREEEGALGKVFEVGELRIRGHREEEGVGKRVDVDEQSSEDEDEDEEDEEHEDHRYEEEYVEDEEHEDHGDEEDEDEFAEDHGAVLSYIPPTAKPLVRERTPISIPSTPIAHPPPTTNKNKKSLTYLTHLPPSTPTRKPSVNLSPTKAVTLTPALAYKNIDPSTLRTPSALRSFKSRRQALSDQFLLELDSQVVNGHVNKKLSHLGGLKVVWSKNLLKTAGYFRYRYKISPMGRVDEDGEHIPGENRIITFAQIELADKVVDDEQRLYSTLAHEFAHAVDVVVGENWGEQRAHGKSFKQWLTKCKKAFPNKDIEVGTCHEYVINYKYHWSCIGRYACASGAWGVEYGCGHVLKRHSKSIDVEIHRCPMCAGTLVQTLPAPKGGSGGGSGSGNGDRGGNNGVGPGLSEYQIFMKERMKVVRRDNPGMLQKEVMRLVGLEWKEKKERGEVGVRKYSEKEERRGKEKNLVGKARVEVIEISSDDDDHEGVNLEDRLDVLRI